MDELVECTVVCHTEGCENEGVAITLLCAESVSCGPCGGPITDVVPA